MTPDGIEAARQPDRKRIEHTYEIPLDDVLAALGIDEPPGAHRSFAVAGSRLVITVTT